MEYTKPTTSKLVEYKPVASKPADYKSNYSTNYYQSHNYQPARQPPVAYTEKPPVNTYYAHYNTNGQPANPKPSSIYSQPKVSQTIPPKPTPNQYVAPIAKQPNYQPDTKYSKPSTVAPNHYSKTTTTYQPAPKQQAPNNQPKYQNQTKPVATNDSYPQAQLYRPNKPSTNSTANYGRPPPSNKPAFNSPSGKTVPKYQSPYMQPPRLEYEYMQYELANEHYKPDMNPPTVPRLPNQPYQPYPQPYQQPYAGQQEYGLVYENELGNRLPYYNRAGYATERDYKLMKMRKEYKELKWRFEYDINTEYSIARSTAYDWINFINLLRTDNALFEKYYRNLHRRSNAARWKIECNEMCRQHLLDEIIVIDPLAY